jgi:hypothetical protein
MLQVTFSEQRGLSIIFEGLKDGAWTLLHNQDAVFTRLIPRNEFARRRRFTTSWFDAEYFELNFFEDPGNNHVAGLTWKHDPSLQEPQRFMEELKTSS